jgi:hypothetical protein
MGKVFMRVFILQMIIVPRQARAEHRQITPKNADDNDHQEGLRQLTTVTGSAPLLPLAAYGVWYAKTVSLLPHLLCRHK